MASSRPVPLEDERRYLTVLFCDLVNYSRLAEKLDLEQQTAVVREVRQVVNEIVSRCGGFVAQYLGDGLLCYFGYPLSHEDSAARSVRAGLEMAKAIEALNDHWSAYEVDLRARVGIHAGIALIGREQLAVGPTVNCASRVQERARPGAVLVTEPVQRLVRGYFELVERGRHELKGFAEPYALFEVLAATGARDRIEAASSAELAPFVNRESERAILHACWKRASQSLSAVLLLGEAGIGKSRTLREFRDELQLERRNVLEARCSEMHRNSALFPLLELMRAEIGWEAGWTKAHTRSRIRERLGAAMPSDTSEEMLAALLLPHEAEIDPQRSLSPIVLRERMLQAVADWISAAANEHPVLFVLEDLHWADPTTLDACSLLLSRKELARLMVVTSMRHDFSQTWPSDAGAEIIRLDRLNNEHVRTLISSLTSAQALPSSTTHRIVRDSDGNPLFIEEITRDAVEGALTRSDGDSGVPFTLHNSLRARLDRLGRSKRVAQHAAVVGREFELDVLCHAFDRDPAETRVVLTQLVELGVLVRRNDRSAGRYEFRHALIHNEAYESITHSLLREYHARVASAITQHFHALAEREPEVLAHHFERAGQSEDAARACLRAGQAAVQRSSFAEAQALFERALGALSRIPHSEARDQLEVDVRAGLGLTLISTRGFTVPEVEDTYQRGLELCERLPDTPLRILYGLWAFNMVRGDRFGTARLVPLFERALARAASPLEELVTRAALGSYSFFRLSFETTQQHFLRVIELIDERAPGEQNAALLRDYGFEGMLYPPLFLAWTYLFQGRLAKSRPLIAKALALGEASGHPYLLCQALALAAPLAHDSSEHVAAGAHAARLLAIAKENQFPYWIAAGMCNLGYALARSGQMAEGAELLKQGLFLFKAIGAFLVYPYYASYLIWAHMEADELDAAHQLTEEAAGIADRALNASILVRLALLQGELAAKRGKLTESLGHFRRVLDAEETRALPSVGLNAAVCLAKLPSLHDAMRPLELASALELFSSLVEDAPALEEALALRAALG